jgi:hypothetical protein
MDFKEEVKTGCYKSQEERGEQRIRSSTRGKQKMPKSLIRNMRILNHYTVEKTRRMVGSRQ